MKRSASEASLKDTLPPASVERPSSPTPSIEGDKAPKPTGSTPAEKTEEIVAISAWGVDKALKRTEMEKAIGVGTRGWVEVALSGLPVTVVSAVQR